jgi:hypothetical protein
MDKRHLCTKGTRQITNNVRFKKYSTNFDARKRIRHIRANETLAPSSLVSQMRKECLLALKFVSNYSRTLMFFTLQEKLGQIAL